MQRTFNVGWFAGRTVTLRFTGTEDASLQTSFVIDDTALNAARANEGRRSTMDRRPFSRHEPGAAAYPIPCRR